MDGAAAKKKKTLTPAQIAEIQELLAKEEDDSEGEDLDATKMADEKDLQEGKGEEYDKEVPVHMGKGSGSKDPVGKADDDWDGPPRKNPGQDALLRKRYCRFCGYRYSNRNYISTPLTLRPGLHWGGPPAKGV